VDALATMVTTEAEHGIRERFARAAEAKMHASESVERGRVYVAAYVEFMHYVERLHNAATTVVMFAGGDGKERRLGPSSLAILVRGEAHSIRALDEDLVFLGFLHGEPTARPGKVTGKMARSER
jgi:hypothetical protein